MNLKSDPRVKAVFDRYPELIKPKMLALRDLVIETANEIDGLAELEETLKWGEPSYLTKNGSTLRMDWKAQKPGQYAMYFKCTSKLVETFKEHFGRALAFEGNRAIVFQLNEAVPRAELKECIRAALTYHKVKQLAALGIQSKSAGK
ncbi:DUF1801 domain-containing protein [Muriicola sp. SD30]|uniref:DUF1801 domain-containing protein n=1 Tax=Muriicola sp. SD30 TaxID=3240936 RepID=UPI00350F26D3